MNLYVSNLMSHITADHLKKLFSEYGPVVSCRVISDRFTGASRGFGFVTMQQDDEAMTAMKELQGRNVEGRCLEVEEARAPTIEPTY
ncbi:RNA recognition motif domain-containing protein [Chitinophaga japonensis]|uniref:RNA recognition motif-containing protein n=1 Tax=Chitinophaga japonensis TaxID=104662 RepID=A0A562SS76_CHIJA|nr:RNA-binding protein [Chitinophaga japonensis]TWI84091.1 RNA recognition motif-containing protein [Chitinophaga japonensis]